MNKRTWGSCLAALLLVFCWSGTGQAGESSDLTSMDGGAPQAQAAPEYTAQLPLASCTTAEYNYDDTAPYSFEDISGTGTNRLVSDDGEVDIPIGFAFDFYCASYTTLTIGGNGALSFDDPATTPNILLTNQDLPFATPEFTTLVAALWDDLDPGVPGAAVFSEVKGTAPNRRLIIQWNAVPRWGIAGNTTFEIILYETTNKILFQYQDVNFANAAYDFGASATVGLQKDGTTAVKYSYNTASLADGMAILFTPYGEIPTPSSSSTGLDYDCHRNGVWNASQDGNLYMYDAESGVLVKTIVMAGKVVAADGYSNGVAVLDNGNLLLSDYNGDLNNIDDYLLEFNPETEKVVNYWPLDGSFNTSTDGTNLDQIRGVEMTDDRFRRAYVTTAINNNVYEIQLTPGKPGTWKTIAVHGPLSAQMSTSGIDKVACYEDTPITGYVVGDRSSTVVNFYSKTFTLNSNFDAGHGTSLNNYGVTVVPGNPAKLWVSDTGTNTIGIFDTQQKCTMHCGKFPWPMFLPGIEQGATP